MRFLVLLLLSLTAASARPWTEEVMYFALTDRFHDGDPTNDVPPGSDPAQKDSVGRLNAESMGTKLQS